MIKNEFIFTFFRLFIFRKTQVSFPKYMAMLAAVLTFEAVFIGYSWARFYPLNESQLYLNGDMNVIHILNNDSSNGSSAVSWEPVRLVNNVDLVCTLFL